MNTDNDPFWQRKTLDELTSDEWESLCDGCGKCCLHKLEDEETGEVFVTNVACRLLDLESCQCQDYVHRKQRVPDCIVLTLDQVEEFQWLPTTCAYRLLAQGQPLPQWHPLVTGDPKTVHAAGISVCGRVVSEVEADDLDLHITDWVL